MSSPPSPRARTWDNKILALLTFLGIAVITTTYIFPPHPPTLDPNSSNDSLSAPVMTSPSTLDSYARNTLLTHAAPIFGTYKNTQSRTSTWMSSYQDSTLLVHMTIPGVHDAATWNYTPSTQSSLRHITDLVHPSLTFPAEWFRCQSRSLEEMLDSGIRAFDLRYALDITKTDLVFWHGPALQSQRATLEAVMFAFYQWLEDHGSEVVFLSFQYEGSEEMGNVDSAEVQRKLYEVLTSEAARDFVLQKSGELGTLGEARGKVVLLKRFDLDLLPESYGAEVPGLHFSPKQWTVNGKSIAINYNSRLNANADSGSTHSSVDPTSAAKEEGVAYIEDYYHPSVIPNSTKTPLKDNIEAKFSAVRDSLLLASGPEHPAGFFWTFTSGTNTRRPDKGFSVTPELMALGGEDADGSVVEGVNSRLGKYLQDPSLGGRERRLGIVMVDFFQEPGELIELLLGFDGEGD